MLFLIISTESIAQSTYLVGALPVVNINKGLKKGWGLNFKAESRLSMVNGEFSGQRERNFEYILTDLSLMASKKVGLNNSIAGGYLTRIRDNKIIHRAIQQFTIVKRYTAFRLAHRFSTDQTFEPGEQAEFRFRYRLTPEIPLNGQSVDPKEWYIKINNEYLNNFQGRNYDLEIRLIPLLGYGFTDNNKVELGIDYRINSFLKKASENACWININWFIAL